MYVCVLCALSIYSKSVMDQRVDATDIDIKELTQQTQQREWTQLTLTSKSGHNWHTLKAPSSLVSIIVNELSKDTSLERG